MKPEPNFWRCWASSTVVWADRARWSGSWRYPRCWRRQFWAIMLWLRRLLRPSYSTRASCRCRANGWRCLRWPKYKDTVSKKLWSAALGGPKGRSSNNIWKNCSERDISDSAYPDFIYFCPLFSLVESPIYVNYQRSGSSLNFNQLKESSFVYFTKCMLNVSRNALSLVFPMSK